MDVSTAPHDVPVPAGATIIPFDPPVATGPAARFGASPTRAVPTRSPATPLVHALRAGAATTLSLALTFCCLLAVGGRLGPGRPVLNGLLLAFTLLAGAYVAVRAFRKQSEPRPDVRGRCTDCGAQLLATDQGCPVCGRPSEPVGNTEPG